MSKRIGLQNNFHNGIYPATPTTLVLTIFVFTLPRLFGVQLDRGGVEWLDERPPLNWLPLHPLRVALGCVLFGSFVWFLMVQAMRLFIKTLLEYKGFMFEPRGRMSLKTKIWLVPSFFLPFARLRALLMGLYL